MWGYEYDANDATFIHRYNLCVVPGNRNQQTSKDAPIIIYIIVPNFEYELH